MEQILKRSWIRAKLAIFSSSTAETSEDFDIIVPPGVCSVQAPYEFRRKNERIVRDFLLSKGDWGDVFLPDISLRTKNALLHSAVYIEDQEWELPVYIYARTKNGNMAISIHPLQIDQAVHLRASTKNVFKIVAGRNDTLLPRDFKGLLIVTTKNGKCTLSADLKKVAVRVPYQYKHTLKSTESLWPCSSSSSIVNEVPSDLSNGVEECYEINGCDKPSLVRISTKNGDVSIGFIPSNEAGCWGGCLAM